MAPNSSPPFDFASYTQTAHAAWSAFMRSRLDAPNGSRSTSEQQHMVEVEFGLLQHYAAIAGQRLNALRPIGRLPEELLAMIFSHAQAPSDDYPDGWMPSRRSEDVDSPGDKPITGGKKKTDKVVRYDLGFIHVTHVCRAWRTAALHNNNLWRSVNCFTLPVRSVSVVVDRAGNLPLRIKAHEGLCEGIGAAALKTWLSGPLLRRAEVLDLTTLSEERLNEWASYLIYPLRSLRELAISTEKKGPPASIPEDVFASQCPPALRSLSLFNCFPEWTSPLFSVNLTHLSLKTPWLHCDVDSLESFPSESEFQRILSNMRALESLALQEFFPTKDPNDPLSEATYCFPSNLLNLRVHCESLTLLRDGPYYLDFFARCSLPRNAILTVDIDMIDDIMDEDEAEITLGAYLAPVTRAHTTETQSSAELMLAHSAISLRFDVADVSPPWMLSQSQSEHPFPPLRNDTSMSADFLDELWEYVPDQWASACVRGGRLLRCNWIDISKYVNLLPLPSIDILSLVPSIMSRFTTAETWLTAFGAARQVERISVSYLRCVHLFSALSRLDDVSEEPSLFPRLKQIVFVAEKYPLDEHQALRTAIDMYFKDFLVIRREAGVPIQHIYVDESLSSWGIWAEVDGGTGVSFFPVG